MYISFLHFITYLIAETKRDYHLSSIFIFLNLVALLFGLSKISIKIYSTTISITMFILVVNNLINNHIANVINIHNAFVYFLLCTIYGIHNIIPSRNQPNLIYYDIQDQW